jgi:hypothetical protein
VGQSIYSQLYYYTFHYHDLVTEGNEHRRKYKKKEERPEKGTKTYEVDKERNYYEI